MSRPRWSVPSQCAALGLASVSAAFVARGSCVSSTLAKIAVNTITRMMKPPAAPSGFRRQNRKMVAHAPGRDSRAAGPTATAAPLTAIAHPGVEHTVEHVHGEVREDHDRGDEHDDRLHDRVVPPTDGLNQEAGDPRQIEDGLGHDESTAEEPDFDA